MIVLVQANRKKKRKQTIPEPNIVKRHIKKINALKELVKSSSFLVYGNNINKSV